MEQFCFCFFFSAQDPKAPGDLINIDRDLSAALSAWSAFSNDFSETAGPISVKFHIQHPGSGRLKICLNGPGLMAKVATMPIYGKNLKKSSSPEPLG